MRSIALTALLFLAIVSAVQVISSANAVHAVFFLVLVFIATSILRLVISMEFMALVFLRVYVGAIAVLFLFVVMRLNVPSVREDFSGNSLSSNKYSAQIPRLGILSGLFFAIASMTMGVGSSVGIGQRSNFSTPEQRLNADGFSKVILTQNISGNYGAQLDWVSNMAAIGQVLYTTYCVEFLVAGVVLLVAMVGAIVLTLSSSSMVAPGSSGVNIIKGAEMMNNAAPMTLSKAQHVHEQHSRDSDLAVFRVG